MKKKTLYFIISAILIVLIALLFAKEIDAADLKSRMYYPETATRYVCTQLLWQTKGINCVVTVGSSTKRMGIGIKEDATGITNHDEMTYENDVILYAPTGELLLVTKVNDDIYGTGWCLMNDHGGCYPLYNNYGRTLLATGTLLR